MIYHLLIFLLVSTFVIADKIDTFYGSIEVEEPVLLELIHSPAFQRLKEIHQYGVSYYTDFREEYTRYEHSLGVFFVLRQKGAPLKEQIAGLLHDTSHTVFSHVGDWVFNKEHQEIDYSTSIHQSYLVKSGIDAILQKYGYTSAQIEPREEFFPMLEQPGPSLCADRIDYNIQGAYFQGFITKSEALEILNDLHFVQGNWVATKQQLMAKLVRFALYMTENCWGSPTNHLASRALADALLQAMDIKLITYDQLLFSTDSIVWELLQTSKDPLVQKNLQKVFAASHSYDLVTETEADLIVKSKFRGIDPWILHNGTLVRITSLDHALATQYKTTKEKMGKGWMIKFKPLAKPIS